MQAKVPFKKSKVTRKWVLVKTLPPGHRTLPPGHRTSSERLMYVQFTPYVHGVADNQNAQKRR